MPSDDLPKDLSYEAAVEQLETLIEGIESGEIGLEQSLTEYERGMKLIAHCKAVLDRAEQKIEELKLDDADEDQADHA